MDRRCWLHFYTLKMASTHPPEVQQWVVSSNTYDTHDHNHHRTVAVPRKRKTAKLRQAGKGDGRSSTFCVTMWIWFLLLFSRAFSHCGYYSLSNIYYFSKVAENRKLFVKISYWILNKWDWAKLEVEIRNLNQICFLGPVVTSWLSQRADDFRPLNK